jgi:hypothetical protein
VYAIPVTGINRIIKRIKAFFIFHPPNQSCGLTNYTDKNEKRNQVIIFFKKIKIKALLTLVASIIMIIGTISKLHPWGEL